MTIAIFVSLYTNVDGSKMQNNTFCVSYGYSYV